MSSGAIVTQEGAGQLLKDLLGAAALENWILGLFTTAHTPALTDTITTYAGTAGTIQTPGSGSILATFTGYSYKTLTRSYTSSTWGTVSNTGGTSINASGNAKSTYDSGTPQTWSATSAQTITGHVLQGATSSVSILAEAWTSSVSLVNPSTLNLTPVIELGAIGG